MKFLLTIGLIYLAYRIFFARPAIFPVVPPRDNFRPDPPPPPPPTRNKKEDGEYIDYEEVD